MVTNRKMEMWLQASSERVAMVTPLQVAHHNSVASAPISQSYVFTRSLSLLLAICLCF